MVLIQPTPQTYVCKISLSILIRGFFLFLIIIFPLIIVLANFDNFGVFDAINTIIIVLQILLIIIAVVTTATVVEADDRVAIQVRLEDGQQCHLSDESKDVREDVTALKHNGYEGHAFEGAEEQETADREHGN